MDLTSNCDVFGAFHEDAINKVVAHVMAQRPSMFNYATPWFVKHISRLCSEIKPRPDVVKHNNPLISVESLLTVPGTNGAFGLDYCMQITDLEIDFHPQTNIQLPPELNPPLNKQTLAMRVKVCVGIACPDKDVLVRYVSSTQGEKQNSPVPLPFNNINCFCLEGFATCTVDMTGGQAAKVVSIDLEGFEIVDIRPPGLENALECFIKTTLRFAVLSKLKFSLDFLTLSIESLGLNLALKPTPSPANVPFNPSIANDQLAVFLDLEVSP